MLLIIICAAEYAPVEEPVEQWLQSRDTRGDDDGVSFDTGPDSDIGGVICIGRSAYLTALRQKYTDS